MVPSFFLSYIHTTIHYTNNIQGAEPIKITFSSNTPDTMPWEFKPQQKEIYVVPGETALAFYSAYNPTDKPVTGVSTYNVSPLKTGVYFHKIQCFCFDEQRLKPGEQVDMPVFFYIDPAILDDPQMKSIRTINLGYTFFKSKGRQD